MRLPFRPCPAWRAAARLALPSVDLASIKPLSFTYEYSPQTFHCAQHQSTKTIAFDKYHPLHTRVQRRLKSVDSQELAWRVAVKVSFSNRKTVRDRAQRRLHAAMVRELHQVGLDPRGRPLPGQTAKPFRGALSVFIQNDPVFVTGTCEEIQARAHVTFNRICSFAKYRPDRRPMQPNPSGD